MLARMIRSFRDRDTEAVFRGEPCGRFARPVQRAAQRKLRMLDAAETPDDLRVPPGNRLEKLVGRRRGQFSVRVNDQWRVSFRWADGDAHEVEIADYH
jgi:proteic killer suppression protein